MVITNEMQEILESIDNGRFELNEGYSNEICLKIIDNHDEGNCFEIETPKNVSELMTALLIREWNRGYNYGFSMGDQSRTAKIQRAIGL